MSRKSITLKAFGRSVRSASRRRFVLAILHFSHAVMDYTDALKPQPKVIPMDPTRLVIRVRSDNPKAVVAAARKIAREEPGRWYYVFDNATGELIGRGNSASVKSTGEYVTDLLAAYVDRVGM